MKATKQENFKIWFHYIMNANPQNIRKKNSYVYYAQISRSKQVEEEEIQVQYQIQRIEDHRFKSNGQLELSSRQMELLQKPLLQIPDNELQYLVKWVDQQQLTWQPGQNLKNAPQILESYKRFYLSEKNMSTVKTGTGKTRGRKPKNISANTAINDKPASSRGRGFSFGKFIRKKNQLSIKQDQDDEEVLIIDKDDYIRGIRQVPQSKVVEEVKKKHAAVKDNRQPQLQKPEIFRQESKESFLQSKEKNDLKQPQQAITKVSKPGPFEVQYIYSGHSLQRKLLQSNQSKQRQQIHQPNPLNIQNQNTHTQAHLSNDRSIMITQQQKSSLENSQKNINEPLYQIQEQRMPEDYCQSNEQIFDSSLSPCQRLIDLFIQKEKKQVVSQNQQSHQKQSQNVYWPQNEKDAIYKEKQIFAQSYQASEKNCNELNFNQQMEIMHQDININPFENINNDQDEYHKNMTPKRNLDQDIPLQIGIEKISKKIKQNQEISSKPDISQCQAIKNFPFHKQKEKMPEIIEIQDDQIPVKSVLNQISEKKSLKQKIHQQLNSLLNQEKVNIGQILMCDIQANQQPQEVLSNNIQKGESQRCSECKRHEQYNKQLIILFNDLLQNSQTIDFDALFLQQETFSVLSTLNPSYYALSSQMYLRTQKMADISENKPICTLISRKIAKIQDLPNIVQYFDLSKLIKIRDDWFGIFKVKPNDQKRNEHFKYVQANQLWKYSRNTIVSFLIR